MDFNEKKHYVAVDITRFIMMLLIMAHHLYLFGYSDGYLGESCWAWVDYFFILTGIFTASHYAESDEKSNCAKEALSYTLKKFTSFIPYVFVAVILQYFLDAIPYIIQHDVKACIDSFVDMPYELLLLSSSGIVWPKLAPVWFLSAMLLTLPTLIYIMLRFQDAWYILCWFLPILYFGYNGINTSRTWPNDLIRAFSSMALGTFAYMIICRLRFIQPSVKMRLMFTIVETGTFLCAIYITIFNRDCMNLLLLLFITNVTIMLSGCSYTSNFKGELFKFLGEISFPMFIFHWVIGVFISRIFLNNVVRTWLYYLVTIIISATIICIKRCVNKNKVAKNKEIEVYG